MFKHPAFLLVLVFLLPISIMGCQRQQQTSAGKQYVLKGRVTEVDKAESTVTIDHEDIPGYMQAMEMKFRVAKSQMLDDVQVGDAVHGRLTVEAGDNVVTELSKQ